MIIQTKMMKIHRLMEKTEQIQKMKRWLHLQIDQWTDKTIIMKRWGHTYRWSKNRPDNNDKGMRYTPTDGDENKQDHMLSWWGIYLPIELRTKFHLAAYGLHRQQII